MHLVILTGASGAGKTSIAQTIGVEQPGFAEIHHFDSVGVPSPEAMAAGWGSGEAWQRATTLEWLQKIGGARGHGRPILFEGQMRFAFVHEGLVRACLGDDARLILVDCDDATRARRLAEIGKSHPADAAMMRWADHLRQEARDAGCEILDTSRLSLEAAVACVCSRLSGRVPP